MRDFHWAKADATNCAGSSSVPTSNKNVAIARYSCSFKDLKNLDSNNSRFGIQYL
jgi:hypothetical protein